MGTGYLNGLRALSALWVLIAHCQIWSAYQGFIPNPKMAVAVFMVLSGYLMALTYDGDVPRFYIRRFFRIAPLYYAALLFMAATAPFIAEGLARLGQDSLTSEYGAYDYSSANVVWHMTFLFGATDGHNTLLPDWSLSLEMQFYAAFPLIVLAIKRYGLNVTCGALFVLSVAFYAVARRYWIEPSFLPLQLPYFLAGVMVFRGKRFLPAIFAIFELHAYGMIALVPGAAVLLIATLDCRQIQPIRGLLDNRVMAVGGALSYGIYLTHGAFIYLSGYIGLGLLSMVAFVFCGSIAVSAAAYRFIELPGMRYGNLMRHTMPGTRTAGCKRNCRL